MMRAASAVILLAASTAGAQLTGSGNNLPLPATIGVQPPAVGPTLSNIINPVSFDGTWSSPAQTPWRGTFHAAGMVPSSSNFTGNAHYDFTSLNAGNLPAGTWVVLSDLDDGSGAETIALAALVGGSRVTTPWLNRPSHVWGSGNGPAGAPGSLDVPNWTWDSALFEYRFAGVSVAGNPTVAIAMPTNTAFEELSVVKANRGHGLTLLAPVPAPASFVLLAITGPLVLRRRR